MECDHGIEVIVANAFLELLALGKGQDVSIWSEERMNEIQKAMEKMGHAESAKKLRQAWTVHRSLKT